GDVDVAHHLEAAPDRAGDLCVVDLLDRRQLLAHRLCCLERDRKQALRLPLASPFDSFEDLFLRLRAEPAQRREAILTRRFFPVVQAANAERLVKEADLLE